MLSSPSWNWLAPGPRRLSRWRLKSRTAILHIHKSVTARRQFHGRGGVASGQPEPPLVGAKRRTRVLVRGVRRSDAPACSRPAVPSRIWVHSRLCRPLSPVARCRQTAWLIFRETHDRPRSLHEKACPASRHPPGGHSTRAFRHCRLDQGDRRPLAWQATFRRETSTAPRTRPCRTR